MWIFNEFHRSCGFFCVIILELGIDVSGRQGQILAPFFSLAVQLLPLWAHGRVLRAG